MDGSLLGFKRWFGVCRHTRCQMRAAPMTMCSGRPVGLEPFLRVQHFLLCQQSRRSRRQRQQILPA